MSWIELKLDIPPESLEHLSSYLFAHGCEGINVTDDGIIIYFTTHRWSNEVRAGISEYIRQIIPGFSLKQIRVKSVTDHDWHADWKKHFKPVKVTNRVVIRPPWEEYHQSQGEVIITINPQMAFGTGHHESTRLVMIELENLIQPDMHILDVGTGSGILGIMAKKLGAESVLGIDNDMEAIKNATENLQLNDISGAVNFGYAELENVTPSDYDLVLANINRNTLVKYATLFPEYVKQDGYLIISGVLRRDEAQISQLYKENGFSVIKKNVMKDWLAIVFKMKEKKDETGSN
jgi:ribosomal protein L11 methyltransferase